MAVENDKLYFNLDKLLNDICKFLSEESNYQKLSPLARKQADELITRSKRQLQEIAKITEYDGAYVDMDRKQVDKEENNGNRVCTPIEESPKIEIKQIQQNPYANLSAKDLSIDMKCGELSWKYRMFLKFEKTKRIYAGIHNDWLLIYSSEKDSKPLQTFYLKNYRAEVVASKQGKSSQDFELISLDSEKKYNFIATSHRDMVQWISYINICNEKLQKTETISEDNDSEIYMEPKVNQDDFNDDDELYIILDKDTYETPAECPVSKPPDLPARRITTATTIQQLEVQSSEESHHSKASSQSTSSFSSDDNDETYQIFVSSNSFRLPQPRVNDAYRMNLIDKNDKPPKPPTGPKPSEKFKFARIKK